MNLILFANHFPYAKSEQFLINEFGFAKKKFENIRICTFTANSMKLSVELGPGIIATKPVFNSHKAKAELLFKGIFNLAPFKYHIHDLLKNKLYNNRAKFRRWFTSLLVTRAALSSQTYESVIKYINESMQGAILYFYWGDNLCWTLPYLKERISNKNVKTVIRFHRTDLYEYVTNDYAPLRQLIFSAADQLVPISMDGHNYMNKMYTDYCAKIVLSKLGVFDSGLNPYTYNADQFTIVSVSFVTPVKRVELILNALKSCTKKITWFHFGDGPLLEILKSKTKELTENVRVNFRGYTKNEQIMDFYKKNSVDLFLNVSSSEGLPVSIMEAVSFGIPVIATNAGGTSEIVNPQTGALLPIDITADELSSEINAFLSLSLEEIMPYRVNARKKYETELDAVLNYNGFYDKIMVIN
ncbi:MAG: glycosyltransferase [Bacteroidota bacterium]